VLDKLKLKKEARQARTRARAIRGNSDSPNRDRLTWSVWDGRGDQPYLRSK
jgi:hypothetical protein